eukprot:366370-Chlamydomonas_euryale.AAC.10
MESPPKKGGCERGRSVGRGGECGRAPMESPPKKGGCERGRSVGRDGECGRARMESWWMDE